MKEFFKKKLFDPIMNLLMQGVTPEKIALSIAFGAVLGVFPILGSTVLLCTGATFIFRLNFVAIQIANYFIYPLQLILFIPFFQIHLSETLTVVFPFPWLLFVTSTCVPECMRVNLLVISTPFLGHTVLA